MQDNILILYYYNDGLTNSERQQVANALATEPSVAERYRELSNALGTLPDPATSGPPSDMVQRWHDSLDRAAGLEMQARPRSSLHSWSFLLGAAVTAALAIGIGIGFLVAGDEEVMSPPANELLAGNPPATASTSSAFIRGLQVHLRESEQDLVALPSTATTGRTRLIMNIVEQNRLYERAARQNDSENLARVLRAFELVLVELAADDISDEDAEALRAKLLFELNVMLTKLSHEPSDEPQSI
jgi:hypothetical protein